MLQLGKNRGLGSALVLLASLAASAACTVRGGENAELVLRGSIAESAEVVTLDPVFLSRQRKVEASFFGFDDSSEGNDARSGGSSSHNADAAQAGGDEADFDVSVPVAGVPPLVQGSFAGASFFWPLEGPVSSPFGMRHGRLHAGIDISRPRGTPVRASADGQVLTAKRKRAYGLVTIIGHDNDHQTLYAHMLRLAVSEGSYVKAGDVLGYVGRTGRATGYHLHFETRVAGGIPQDPMRFLPRLVGAAASLLREASSEVAQAPSPSARTVY